ASGAPWKYGSTGRGLVDLGRGRPCGSVVCGETVGEVVVVGEDDVDVACLVDADVDELVAVGDAGAGIDVDGVVCEGQASIGGDGEPDGVESTVCACRLGGCGDAAQRLVDVVVGGVDGEVAYCVLEACEPEMICVEGVSCLCECESCVVGTCDDDVVGCGYAVIGYA